MKNYSAQKFEEWKEAYLGRLRNERRLQESSLQNYSQEIELLQRIISEGDEKDLIRHLASKAPSTHQRKLTIWKSFLQSCPSPWNELLKNAPQPKLRQKQPRFLTEEEIFKLENACFRTKKPSRDRLFIGLALQLGLRLQEILKLKVSDFETDWLRVVRKGDKEQRLPLTVSLQASFHFWKTEEQPSPEEFIFRNSNGQPISSRAAQKRLDELAKSAGLQNKLSPHALRHSFATRLASRGASLASIKEFLGHERLTTTERYLHVTPEHLRDSLQFLDPKKQTRTSLD